MGLVGGSLQAPPAQEHLLAVCPKVTVSETVYDPVRDNRHAPEGFDFTGANFALRRDVALRIGPFDECMGVGAVFASAEDLDYKFRLEAAGVRMRLSPRVSVTHTHGCRYGLKAVFRHRRSYAIGQGALAAKMTLQGDPRGQDWLRRVRSECLATLWNGRPHRFPNALIRYLYLKKAYRACLRHPVDAATGLYAAHAPQRSSA